MKVSIIIPSWNTSGITLKCVKTIQQYLTSDYAQIIIVDNGSTDDTEKQFTKLSNIVYIRNSSNLGFAKANNIGVKSAKGDYLLFLNSDMEVTDSNLKKMVKILDTHPGIGAIGPQFLNPDLTPQGSVFPPQTPLNAFKEYWLGLNSYSKYTPPSSTPIKVWAISGGAILIRRDLFIKIGGWNKKYFMFFEDLELCRNIRKLKYQIFYYPQCKVIHRHGASGHTVADPGNQWRRLIPSSKKYFGPFIHYLIFSITWSSQKFHKIRRIFTTSSVKFKN